MFSCFVIVVFYFVALWRRLVLIDFMLIWIYRSRKLNSQLENAIQEAMLELDRMTEQQQSVSAAVGNESTGRLRRSTRRWPCPSLSSLTSFIPSSFQTVRILSCCSSAAVVYMVTSNFQQYTMQVHQCPNFLYYRISLMEREGCGPVALKNFLRKV